MINAINQFLDKTTMYKVVSYSLFVLIAQAALFSLVGLLAYNFFSLVASFFVIMAASLITHFVFQKIYKAPANIESTYISVFIVFLILAPSLNIYELLWSACASGIIIASKYIVTYSYRHIFNPVAFGLVAVGLMGSTSVTWWIGSKYFLPTLLVVGFLVLLKLKRQTLFFGYLVASILTISALTIFRNGNVPEEILQYIISGPLLFLGVFMLTEPLTTPPTKKLQSVYGVLVGVLSSIPFAFPPLYNTPELALLIGNVFSYFFSTKSRVFLQLVEKKEIAKDIYEFSFTPKAKIAYKSGQYMEWTFPHAKPDIRGIRRYFTIASSPLEDVIRLGVRYSEKGSTFKQKLFDLHKGKGLLVTSVMGDFMLPKDVHTKMVFIAGGIGITPYISMLRTLLLTGEKRDIVLFYANKTEEEIAYKDVIEEAKEKLGISTVHILADKEKVSSEWKGETGFITPEMITKNVSEYKKRVFYISGPPQMVTSYSSMFKNMGIASKNIKTDFFPGFN